MGEILLPGPARSYKLPLTLALVQALEDAGGGLFKTADRLVQKELPLTDIIRQLQVCYTVAGCKEDLGDFLLGKSPVLLLTDVLVGILTPLHELGAVLPGEPSAAPGGG